MVPAHPAQRSLDQGWLKAELSPPTLVGGGGAGDSFLLGGPLTDLIETWRNRRTKILITITTSCPRPGHSIIWLPVDRSTPLRPVGWYNHDGRLLCYVHADGVVRPWTWMEVTYRREDRPFMPGFSTAARGER